MSDVAIIGGGPAGLSAALFTAKNGLDTVVFDTDDTWLHMAHLFNYLGIESIDGSEFVEVAREQVTDHGADLHQGEEVTAIDRDGDGFAVTTDDGEYGADYVVIAAGGAGRELAAGLGCEVTGEEDVVVVDQDGETSVEDAYAAGSTVRDDKYQAAISVGGGAAAAIDILSKEAGEPFHDFDTPEDA